MSQIIQVLGLGIASSCGLFLLGNYGVEGNFRNNDEAWFFSSVMIAGGASLLITAIWKGLVIRGEIKRDQENAAAGVSEDQGPTLEGAQAQDAPVTELATAFVGLGVLATTAQVGLVIAQVSTGDTMSETAASAFLPIVVVLYGIGIFAKPRQRDRGTMLFFRAHFISIVWISEGAYMIWAIRDANTNNFIIALVRVLLQTIFFHYALRLRASRMV